MPSDRTFVTELATGLGILGAQHVGEAVLERSPRFSNLTGDDWDRLETLWRSGAFASELSAGFANGSAFLTAPDALALRPARIVEWTGGRRAPGDEVVPSDLRVDHVYLISCKYMSHILHNVSPARLVDALLASGRVDDSTDWYLRIAPEEYQALYEVCRRSIGVPSLPPLVSDLTATDRRRLAACLVGSWPDVAREAYAELCEAVSLRTATLWTSRLAPQLQEAVLWRLLRIGSAPYTILGSDDRGSMRLRIDTPWDWRQLYRFRRLRVVPQLGGQPRVEWHASYCENHSGEERVVSGHVELRWSHGRFALPPEAKVYLDTLHDQVPGYNPLGGQDWTPRQLGLLSMR